MNQKKSNLGFLLAVSAYLLLLVFVTIFEKSSSDANIQSFTDALWYSIVTLTTVGYGDYYPVTVGGKIAGLFLILGGVSILGFTLSVVNNQFNSYMEKRKNGLLGTDFNAHYIIIGWDDFGKQVAEQVLNADLKVAIVVDNEQDRDLIKHTFKAQNCFVLFSDFRDFANLKLVNIDTAKAVYINFKEDTESLIYSINIKKAYPEPKYISTCTNPEFKQTLLNSGVDYVISHEEVVSSMVASCLFEPHVAEYCDDLLNTSRVDEENDIIQVKINAGNPYVGKRFFDAFVDLKKTINATLIGMVNQGKLLKDPDNNMLIEQDMYAVLIAAGKVKKEVERVFGTKEGV